MRNQFLNKWVTLDFYGTQMDAQIIDVEFDTDLGQPLFLMKNIFGNLFWLTRKELKMYEIKEELKGYQKDIVNHLDRGGVRG